MFQSTRPRGARHSRPGDDYAGMQMFQSTRPRGARLTEAASGFTHLATGFNPRARAGRDCRSIRRAGRRMFQSTRPRGARPGHRAMTWRQDGFNPRARAGRDSRSTRADIADRVSIHAPARGATLRRGSSPLCDILFQSTRPRGARRGAMVGILPRCSSFNPRARAGRDSFQRECLASVYMVSIHAPARGATRRLAQHRCHRIVSIHAPARGATLIAVPYLI